MTTDKTIAELAVRAVRKDTPVEWRGSVPEMTFQAQLRQAGVRGFLRNYKFHPRRKFELDFADPARRIAVEIMGGVYSKGAHTRGSGYTRDCEKANEAVCLGWRVLRGTSEQVANGELLAWLLRLIK